MGVGALQMLLGLPGGTTGITARFVNEYACNFSASTTATATVPAVDLVLPASATKQILVFFASFAGLFSQVTINGVRAGWITVGGQFMGCCSAVYAGSGPFNIVVTVTSAITELGGVMVYELDNCAKLYESTRGVGCGTGGVGGGSANFRQQAGALAIAGGWFATDTQAFTWTGLTENFDADVGAYRMSSAVNLATVGSRTALGVSTNPPTTADLAALGVLPSGFTGIRGGFHGVVQVAGVSTTFTTSLAAYTNLNDVGNFDLVICVCTEANVTLTGATFNAVAMTSRGSVVNTGPTPDLIVHFFSISLTAGSASGNVVITASASIAGINGSVGYWKLYGVASYGTVVSSTGNPGTGATTAVTNSNGGAILFGAVGGSDNQIALSGGIDSRAFSDLATSAVAFGDVINDASGTYNITTTFTSQPFAQAGLPIS